jgi:hypothetical protein
MKGSRVLLYAALVGILLTPCAARATPLNIGSDNANTQGDGTGHFTGSLDYEYTSGTTATFTVNLTNTTAAGGHYLTGFLFNNPGDKITGVTAGTPFTNADFKVMFHNANLAGSPWGNFDIGAALGKGKDNDWDGGGNPNNGLAPNGGSGTFTFILTGTASDLASLNTMSFVKTQSTGGGGGQQSFAVRFRGGTNSDKEPGMLNPAPEPSSMLLWSLSGLGILGYRWRRRQRAA